MAVTVDPRLTNADSLPEVQENFNRVLNIIDEAGEDTGEAIEALQESAASLAESVASLAETKQDKEGDVIIASSTEGSTKKFKLAVDDDGELTAVEVVEPEQDPEPDPQEGE